MAELLKVMFRGITCDKRATVRGFGDEAGYLQCDLTPGHPGPLHYDAGDRIWWAADSDD
jgi:hypothetical protein